MVSFGGLAAATSALAARRSNRNRYYDGPASDHFDGVRFFNPGHPWRKTHLDLLKWRWAEGKEAWPERYDSPYRDKPPARVPGAGLRVTMIGHASLLIQTGGLNILTDPVYGERASPVGFAGPQRRNAPGIAFEDLPSIDVVLLTHNHYDHLDIDTMRRLAAQHRMSIVTPLGNDTILREAGIDAPVTVVDWGDAVPLSEVVTAHAQPCLHWSARGVFDRRMALWAAFVLTGPAGVVYHIGDTGYGDGRIFADFRSRFGAPRLAILPIGAYEPRWFMKDQHVNPAEAVAIMQACGAEAAIGHHWGTFKLTDEGIERPLEALATALAEHAIAPERFRPLRPGEVWGGQAEG